jgi:predicted nuclease of predicted toxin-antitoxin system
MKFKTDENLPVEAAVALRAAGYDAVSALDQRLGGGADSVISGVCRDESRILVTLDVDFADIRAYPPADFPGFVVFRLENQSKPAVLAYIERVAKALASGGPVRQLWIVEPMRIRVRE